MSGPLVIANEIYKGLMIQWSYKFNLVAEIAQLGIIFVGIGFFMGGGSLDPHGLASMLLGYIIWFYAVWAISQMSYDLMSEAQAGTLEQMYMSPVAPGMVVLGRTLSGFLVSSVMIVVMGGVLILLLGIELPLRLAGVPILVLTLVGLLGFGYIIGGITLIAKQIGPMANLMQNALLFLNGTILPVDRLPRAVEAFAHALPSTQGIIVLRQVVLEGQTLAQTWANGELIWLAFHSGLYLIVGWFVWKLCERMARQQGTLGHY